jgi:hypothetical protein
VDAAEEERLRQYRVVRGDELREERRVEDGDLRVQQVADEALAEGRAAPLRRACLRRLPRLQQRLDAEVHQIRGAEELQHRERFRARAQQRRDAERRRRHPHEEAGDDSDARREGRVHASAERVAHDQRHVHAGRDGHERGDDDERDHAPT